MQRCWLLLRLLLPPACCLLLLLHLLLLDQDGHAQPNDADLFSTRTFFARLIHLESFQRLFVLLLLVLLAVQDTLEFNSGLMLFSHPAVFTMPRFFLQYPVFQT